MFSAAALPSHRPEIQPGLGRRNQYQPCAVSDDDNTSLDAPNTSLAAAKQQTIRQE